MKTKVKKLCEIEIKFVRIEVAVRYEEEDIPNDFPMREGDMWKATVDIDTGKIQGWPTGKSGDIYMKVCDQGSYRLLAYDGSVIASREQEYVPHGVVPGKYGDYIDLKISHDGTITNWPKKPNVSVFFGGSDED